MQMSIDVMPLRTQGSSMLNQSCTSVSTVAYLREGIMARDTTPQVRVSTTTKYVQTAIEIAHNFYT